MIKRDLEDKIVSKLNTKKAIILLGPRQTGKTTLLEKIADMTGDCLLIDCDDPVTRSGLESANTEELKRMIGNHKTVFIDEAQRVKNIGLAVKIIVDRIKNVQLLVSGSSSLDLMSEINEPLTGRKWEYMLYPISGSEHYRHFGHIRSRQLLETRLIYGMYPDVINNPGGKGKYSGSLPEAIFTRTYYLTRVLENLNCRKNCSGLSHSRWVMRFRIMSWRRSFRLTKKQ